MNDRKLIFFTSDWHIGHERAIELDSRPFRDADHMGRVLVNNFNSTVPKDAITYFAGDMGMHCKNKTRDIVAQLNGTKVFILGNHDLGMNAMYAMGFDVVLNAAMLIVAGEKVTISHCPLRGVWREDTTGMKGANDGDNWHGEYKQHRFSIEDNGQFHLHGHIHSPNHGKSQKILGKQYDIGVVANGYRPVSISVIESWIAKYGR